MQNQENPEQLPPPEQVPLSKDVTTLVGAWMAQQAKPDLNRIQILLNAISGSSNESARNYASRIQNALTRFEKFTLSVLRSQNPHLTLNGTQWTWGIPSEEVEREPGSVLDIDPKTSVTAETAQHKTLNDVLSEQVTAMIKHEAGNKITPAVGYAQILAMQQKEGEVGLYAQEVSTRMGSLVSHLGPLLTDKGQIQIGVNPDEENPITITRIPQPPDQPSQM